LSDAGALQEFLAGGAVNISLYDSAGFTPKTDSDLDLGVIAHEFGHGVSNRLTCGPSVSSGLNNAEQMGEGWSDFLSLALTVRSGQVGTTKRGIGNWLVGEDASGGGIRTYPYSTNMAVNPHTYNNIKTQSVNGKTGVHYVGEVWCVMLWDLHWKMVEKYGYSTDLIYGSAGNNKAIELVMAGMKLQKCNPGFVDGRDAILQADTLLNGGANGDLIWSVFARRGLGLSASQGSSNSTSDGTQAFDVPTSAAGTQTLNKAIAIAYPIPTSDELVVEATSVKTLETITVTDASGRKAQVSVKSRTEDACILDVRSLTPGIYFIQVTSSNQKEILRFQKI
jgi:extracellular elastinolytic metalloproteinase